MMHCPKFCGVTGLWYNISKSIINQDNLSSMLLAKHGKTSSSRRTRYLDIRYLFIKDRLDKKEERLEMLHEPSAELLAEFFTKPLQGKQFTTIRDKIMGLKKIE